MKKTIKNILFFIPILIFIVGFVFFFQTIKKPAEPISATSFKLNTVVDITIYDSQDESLLEEAMTLCDHYENIFSRTKETSEVYQLNHGTLPKEGNASIISPALAELTAKGLEYGRLSQGAFDITIAPVSSLWDFTSEAKKIPSKEEIQAKRPLVNYQNVILEEAPSPKEASTPSINTTNIKNENTSPDSASAHHTLLFKEPGMGLDLGAIAKGYIADKIKEFLVSKGVKSAIINLGGNVLCIGSKPDQSPFKIGIQKPFADRKETIATIDIQDKSVVSSGVYERFFEKDGQLYHHILNPETGYPYDNSLISVTIISEKSVDGDGLSTSCFALGLEKGMELINSLPDTHAVFITEDYTLHYSKDFPEINHI